MSFSDMPEVINRWVDDQWDNLDLFRDNQWQTFVKILPHFTLLFLFWSVYSSMENQNSFKEKNNMLNSFK